jgi:Lon protease-like protein
MLCGVADLADLGIFPLDLVLLPGERIPLHLFEPRYRQLYADCVLGDRPFVVVRTHEDHIAQVGCAARFDELVQRFDDGRLAVVVLGVDPVELVEETEGNMYLSALCRPLADEAVTPDPGLQEEVRDRFRRLAERVTGEARPPELPEGVPLSYAVAGVVEIADGLKQRLLETRDENARLGVTKAALDAALRSADRAEMAAARAKTNGKVSH